MTRSIRLETTHRQTSSINDRLARLERILQNITSGAQGLGVVSLATDAAHEVVGSNTVSLGSNSPGSGTPATWVKITLHDGTIGYLATWT